MSTESSGANFALLGVAGYVAPRHLEAIKQVGGNLVACFDPHDSVGVIDRYFPDAEFFTEFERFDRHVYELQRSSTPVHYVSICSPNHLHDSHIRWALRVGADAVCEKPLVLHPSDLDKLSLMEESSGRQVHAILQLRLHDAIRKLRASVLTPNPKRHQVRIVTVTPRGNWYHRSWKGNKAKSGGLATNIGIHLFDMLLWVFGDVKEVHQKANTLSRSAGTMELDRASVEWDLSIAEEDLGRYGQRERKPFREITIDGEQFSFAKGFEELHIKSYEEILAGRGFSSEDARPAIELLSRIS